MSNGNNDQKDIRLMKQNVFLSVIAMTLILTGCGNGNSKKTSGNEQTFPAETAADSGWEAGYDRIEAADLPDNVFDLIGNQWMLVTAGNKESYNTMTASWGGLTYVWERPSTIMYIRDSRYTYQFLQREESFTLSFFTEQYRGALRICGTKSGRDTDKVKEAGLTPVETPSGLMSFAQARMIIECKKMLVQELDYANLTAPYKAAIMEESYNNEPSKHQLFISEITHIWLKK